jgi:uncharacterized membrane protein YhaH (DUF805 family)
MDVGQWYVRRGRISRMTFVFQYLLPLVLASYLAAQADSALGLSSGRLLFWVNAATTVPFIAAAVTRLHDFRGSAWRLLFLLIPFLGVLFLAVALIFCRGDEVSNRYGPPPAPSRRPWLPAALRREQPSAHDIDIEARPSKAQGR